VTHLEKLLDGGDGGKLAEALPGPWVIFGAAGEGCDCRLLERRRSSQSYRTT